MKASRPSMRMNTCGTKHLAICDSVCDENE